MIILLKENNMSQIKTEIKDGILKIEKIRARKTKDDIEEIELERLEYKEEYKSKIKISNQEEQNKIFLIQELEGINEEGTTDAIVVYSGLSRIMCKKAPIDAVYRTFVKVPYKILKASISKKYLKFTVFAYFKNLYGLDVKDIKFSIDSNNYKDVELKQYVKKKNKIKMLLEKNTYKFKFKISDLIDSNEEINNYTSFLININGLDVQFKLGIKDKKIKKKKLAKKYYNLPMKSKYIGDYAIHIRRTIAGNLILVKRLVEPIEKKIKFKFLESKAVSKILYGIGKKLTKIRRKNINIFYEKFASKAEEGVYELYSMCKESKISKNYFVIDTESPDYQKIKADKNVVKRFSFKYYWLIYNAKWFVASEAPSHLNVLRSNNKYFRKATYDKNFVFLQHGIIYMKNLGKNSSFKKGKEGESQYMVVSSEKERDVVVDMLGYNEEQLLKTGLAMYSNIEYNHINNNSEDIITIMLTWKPYEENLYNFEESSYYQNIIEIYEILKTYTDSQNIKIVAHPKVYDLLCNTDIKDSIWQEPISEVLKISKLFITDYSSACYNAFYQGAGVIFYQPDLELYELENGELIPNEDEYIGKRALNKDEFIKVLNESIKKKKIDLNVLRTKEQEEIYKTINEFSDGENTKRIHENLKDVKIV